MIEDICWLFGRQNFLQALHKLCESSETAVYLICGPKNTGKSSFARLLGNHLLSSGRAPAVGFLESDCGQPAYGPPGFVSLSTLRTPELLSPVLTQQEQTWSTFIGDTTAESNPVLFVRAVAQLASLHRSDAAAGMLLSCALACSGHESTQHACAYKGRQGQVIW